MDGLGRLIGAGNYLELDGRAVLMEPVRLRDLAIIENWLLSNEPGLAERAVRAALEIGSPKLAERMRQKATDDIRRDKDLRVIPCAKMEEWLNTPDGLAFTAWLALTGKHPLADRGWKELKSYFRKDQEAGLDYQRKRDACSGLDLLAVLDWPEPWKGPARRQAKSTKPKYIAWKKMFRHFATEYGWTAEDVGTLTLYNLNVYCVEHDSPTLGGTAQVTREDAERLAKMPAEERRAYLQMMHAERAAAEGD